MNTSFPFQRILIIQTAFLGDVILATGILRKLKTHYPEAKIDFLLKKGNQSILNHHPDVNQIIVFDKTNKWKELWRIIKLVRKSNYDLLINLHRFASSGIITALSGAAINVGFNKNPLSVFFSKDVQHVIGSKENPFHETQRNHTLISEYTDPKPAFPYLNISAESLEKTIGLKNKKYICISPTSVWYTKQWPEEKWTTLIKKIPEDITIYLLGGSDDKAVCERIKNNTRRNHLKVLAGQLSLIESAALMKDAIISFVNDSAPTHLASAVNAPVCTIYCSTVPEFGFTPTSNFSRIIEAKEHLTCRPCNLHGFKNCPKGHFKCANSIDVNDCYNVFEEALKLSQ
ncbi:MAG: glycosyltransferase family 9 protein [Cytophagales bacterium]|nr:MAG: glycosyltransferase family 9 protein [Cytophagales bacterium]